LAMDFVQFIEKDNRNNLNYDFGINLLCHLVKNNVHAMIKKDEFININYPNKHRERISGVEKTFPGRIEYSKKLEQRQDTRGHNYYWIGSNGDRPLVREIIGSDCLAVKQGFVSVSSLSLHNRDFTPGDELMSLIEKFVSL